MVILVKIQRLPLVAISFCDKTMVMMVVPHYNAYLRLGIEFYFLQSGTYHELVFSHE